MGGPIWISDREPGIRQVFGELLPEASVLAPDELDALLSLGKRPTALVIDGTQLLELPGELRAAVLALPRLLVCTGMMLAAFPMTIISGPGVAVLAKPFCVEDLEAAIEWLRGGEPDPSPMPPGPTLVQRRRPRSLRGRLPAS
ncbi:MAG: hypothetical protein K5924_07570 [Chloroflexi bacterium]|nr:hypothetical protein [Chloroflexota bacterium]